MARRRKPAPVRTHVEQVGSPSVGAFFGALLDAAIVPIAPQFVARRREARHRLRLMAAGVGFDAAEKSRLTADWVTRNGSPDAINFPDATTLIDRAREQGRNTSAGRSLRKAYERNVVSVGIMPFPDVLDVNGEPDDKTNRMIERHFDAWARNPRWCDVEQRSTFPMQQRQMVGRRVEDGEVFVLHVTRRMPGSPSPLALQRLEPDHLDIAIGVNPKNGNEIRRGIEIGAQGQPIAYHFLDRPRGDLNAFSTRTTRVLADRVFHYYGPERIAETHGHPLAAPTMRRIRGLAEYDEWSLIAAKTQAGYGLVVNTEEGEDGDDGFGLETPEGDDGLDVDRNAESIVQPGMVWYGKKGETITGVTATQPSSQYHEYVRAQQGQIAAAVDLSPEQVSRDFSHGRYSSQRQAMLEDRRALAPWQVDLIDLVLTPAYQAFLVQGVMAGSIELPGFFEETARFIRVEWQPPGWPWIDPQKEAEANVTMRDNNMTTLKEICGTRGLNWRRVLEQLQTEKRVLDELGLPQRAEQTAPVQPADIDTDDDDADEAGRRVALFRTGA